MFGKGGAGVYRPPPPPSATGNAPPPRLGKDGAGAGVLKDLDAKTIAAKFAWYVEQFEKTYDIEEYADRFKAFSVTLKEIHQHEEDHKVGLNKFSDWTLPNSRPIKSTSLPLKRHAPQTHKTTGKPLPTEVDWRKEGSRGRRQRSRDRVARAGPSARWPPSRAPTRRSMAKWSRCRSRTWLIA